MTVTYTATDPAGAVHKRTTRNRTYTHTVVIRGGYERALAGAKHRSWANTDAINFAHYQRRAAGNIPHFYTDEAKAEAQAIAQAAIAGHTIESYVHARLVERVKAVEKKRAKGYYDRWSSAGWCGRRELAEKLAAKWRDDGYEAVILDAVAQ